ncbi:hypothetical protein IJF91_02250 [Candidatus Saccharibacteria bacterium]|nr:hypothetical protein [Candidatus Saccharibacteria bacterium]
MAEKAVGKRIKISKIQQQNMVAVLITSLIFGVCLVFTIFFAKYIVFNTTVIAEKDKAIDGYYSAIKNVGICLDKNNDGKFTDKELQECVPEDIAVEDIPGTLRYNALVSMSENTDLESVARESLDSCYDVDGRKLDFTKAYQAASTEEERAEQLYMLKMCSSLRVIPDALPAFQNEEALLSSMNQIFLLSDLQPEALSPGSSGDSSPISELQVIPISVSIENNINKTTTLLQNLERSIRSFYFTSATFTWQGTDAAGLAKLKLSGQALAFYTNEIEATETQKTIYASKEARKASGTTATVDAVDATVNKAMGN